MRSHGVFASMPLIEKVDEKYETVGKAVSDEEKRPRATDRGYRS